MNTCDSAPNWRDLADLLTPKQVEWLTEFENGNRPPEELLDAARELVSTRGDRLSVTASVTAALEGSGLQADCRAHHLTLAEAMIAAMGLQSLTATELVALNAILTPAHGRFLISARVEGRRRGEGRRRLPKSPSGPEKSGR